MATLRVAAIVVCLTLCQIAGQSIFGEIRGNITDASGAFVPNAAVTVLNTGTSERRSVTTDASGSYSVVNLEAGNYDVLVEASGFRPAKTEKIILRARDVVRVDTSLEITQVGTEVLVTAARQVITTDIGTIVDTKSTQEIAALPVNFRAGSTNSVYAAISYAPGVQTDRSGALSVGGGMPFMATSTVDGISNVNVRSNGTLTDMFPSADSIDEIKVSSVSNNAEFAQAGDITVTSRAGSNQYHGSLFWYHQNGAFDARDFFSTRTGAPFKVSNDFGGSFGGPVIKNKTFVFGVYEALRYRTQAIVNQTVPPAAWRTGDLSSVVGTIRDPLSASGDLFPNNRIPESRISPQSRALLQALYPLPTIGGNSISTTNYRVQPGSANDNDGWDVRVDHVFSGKHSIFGRFSDKEIVRSSPSSLFDTLGDDRTSVKPRNSVFAWNYLISTSLVNEFRFGYSNNETVRSFGPGGQSFDGLGLVRQVGIQGIRADAPTGASVPDIGISGLTATGKGREALTLSNTWQFANNVTWIRGRHSFKFGADVRRLRTTDITSFFSGDDLGEYRFSGNFSGNAFADFLLGLPNQTRVANTGRDVDGVTYHTGVFAQDDFKLSRRFTLNLGVRYEVHPMFLDNALTTSNFDRAFPGPGARVIIANEEARKFTAPAFIQSIGNTPIVTAKEAGLPETLRFNDWNNFNPRIGFAWRPWGDRTVVRGGYGIYTVTILGSVFYTITGIHVSDVRTFTNSIAGGTPQITLQRPFATQGVAPIVGTADFRRGTQFDGKDPYAQQWNMTVERDLGWNTSLRLTYTGVRTVKMFSSPDLNQVPANTIGYAAARPSRPYPNWNIVFVRDPNTAAWYNSFTAEGTKRFSNGLFFQSAYVWAKHLSNATGSNGSGFAAENGAVPTDRYNLNLDTGNVATSRRHRFVTSFLYRLPIGRTTSPLLRALAGGWEVGGIALLQTGPFLTPSIDGRTDPSGTNTQQRASDRPDYTGTSYGNRPSDERTVDSWFDRSAFAIPASNIGRFGNVGPGQLVGPGTQNFSAKVQKRFAFTESTYLQLEGSFANLFNHANFEIPGLNVSNTNFGRITATQGVENGGSRSIQVGLRLAF
ncbi:MAG: TonB-dependent receptor [Bryobacteraceae bacterium]|nr:TonB-dependent receptor [Bryobacteraceae bacterium]